MLLGLGNQQKNDLDGACASRRKKRPTFILVWKAVGMLTLWIDFNSNIILKHVKERGRVS
jgi:hypothetical protein